MIIHIYPVNKEKTEWQAAALGNNTTKIVSSISSKAEIIASKSGGEWQLINTTTFNVLFSSPAHCTIVTY